MKKKTEGQEKVLEVGDIVPAEEMESLVYEQETEQCSTDNQDNCHDTFSYIPMSSW